MNCGGFHERTLTILKPYLSLTVWRIKHNQDNNKKPPKAIAKAAIRGTDEIQ